MQGNYNNVARFYDSLSRFVFGDAIVKAQQFLVKTIAPESSILIVGGGTGWILEEITKRFPHGLSITYIDLSEKMVALARKRNVGGNTVTFINAPIQDAVLDHPFDVVITPFLLDNFSAATANVVFNKIDTYLRFRGAWLFSDFQITNSGSVWQKPMLKLMYLFFKILCEVEANDLPDTDGLFQKHGYTIVSSKAFFHNFVCSAVYSKGG